MTRIEQLGFIRAKCVEANPKGEWLLPIGAIHEHGGVVAEERPIRLADVLLAMQAKAQSMGRVDSDAFPIGIDFNGHVLNCDEDCNNVRPMRAKWDLRKDLHGQSPECIAFFTALLR